MDGTKPDASEQVASLDGVWRASEPLPAVLRSRVGAGLCGAVAGGTRVAWHDPLGGGVGYRGHLVSALRGLQPDELMVVLLTGALSREGEAASAQAARQALYEATRLPGEMIEWVALTERRDDPLQLMRAGISVVACFEPAQPEGAGAADAEVARVHAAMRLIGQAAGLITVQGRRRLGHPLQREYETPLGLSERLLSETRTVPPTAEHVARFNDIMLCIADLGLTPAAFAGLVVASCEADAHTAVVAALSGLEGEVQRAEAAPAGNAADAADAATSGEAADAEATVPDERREWLAQMLAELRPRPGARVLALEQASLTALALEGLRRLGVDEALVPCLYCFGRLLGIVARIHEQATDNRIFRPLARYVGPAPRHVPPLETR